MALQTAKRCEEKGEKRAVARLSPSTRQVEAVLCGLGLMAADQDSVGSVDDLQEVF
jgi:hypothetical protein